MGWLFFTLLSTVIASVASILQRVLMKGDKSNPYAYAIIFHFLIGFLVLVFASIQGASFSILHGNVLMLLVAGALWGSCQVFLFKAFQLLEASEVMIVSDLRVVVTIIASVIFLGEVVTGGNILGAILILAATFLIADMGKGFVLNKGVWYTIAAALLAGLAIVADSVNAQQYDVLVYSVFSNFFSGFFILAFYPRSLQRWKHFIEPNFLIKILPLAALSATQGVLYLLALAYGGNTAQVGTIRQASVILTVLLAIVFLNERNKLWKKLVGAILVTAGVFLLR